MPTGVTVSDTGADGYLYFTANQVKPQPSFHDWKDLRQKPHVLFRLQVNGTRVRQQ